MVKKSSPQHQKPTSQQSAAWLKTLYEITRDVNSSLALKQCLRTITRKAVQLLKVERASLMLLDLVKKELTIEYATGLSKRIVRQVRIKVGQGVSGWVAKTGRPLLIQDIRKDRRFQKLAGGRYHTDSLLSVPLKAKGKVIGVLNVNNKKGKKVFTRQDLQLLSALANEAAIAIDNSRLYEQLLLANERLKGLDRLKSEFVASVSHELRTPLATMQYFASILLGNLGGNLTEPQREYLKLIEGNVDRLTRLIDNLLDLSRIESGRLELKQERTDLKGLILKSIDSVRQKADEKRLSIQTDLPKEPLFLYVDKDRLTEVLINLLDNALKFSPEGKRIFVTVRLNHKKVSVSVRDEGVGIPKEEQARIFERFQQGSLQPLSREKGIGLGLAIAKEILTLHHGEIGVESKLEEGATFTFALPVYDEEEFFLVRLEEELKKARKTEATLSLLIVEIRGFAGLRQRLGEEKGRGLLERVEACVHRTVRRPSDVVTSYKRGEVIAVLAGTDRRGIGALTRRLKQALQEERTTWELPELLIGFGNSTYPEDGTTPEELLEKAKRSIEKGVHVG